MQLNYTIDDEVINIEWAAKNDKTPPKGRKYQYLVDEKLFVSETETKTREEILQHAGKTPVAGFILRQKIKGSWITIKPGEIVDFTTPGVEKFKTLPNDQTEGRSDVDVNAKSLKRDFALLEEDEAFLNSLGLGWETVKEGQCNWVLVHNYILPIGYNKESVTVAFRLTPNYPIDQIDMAYLYPAISRTDNQPIMRVTPFTLQGKIFQQWSRHRTAANPWRSGIDNLSTHYPLVEAWLLKEFEKRPQL